MTFRLRDRIPESARILFRNARWAIRAAARSARRTLGGFRADLYAVGDSHAKFNFEAAPEFRVRHLGAVTMHRIARDGRAAVSLKPLGVLRGDVVVWCLGEIDVRCHLIKQRDLQREPVESLADSLARRFLRSVAAIEGEIGGVHTLVLAVIPQLDRDDNPEYTRVGTFAERAEARRLLNAALQKHCREEGFAFFDPYEGFVNPDDSLKLELSDYVVHAGPTAAPIVARRVLEARRSWLGARSGGSDPSARLPSPHGSA